MAFDTSAYDLLKKTKQNEALLKKNNTLSGLDNQETGINNTYADLMATLQKRKSDAETAKQNQLSEGENKFATQRDEAVQGVNNSMAYARDWLASHGIAGSNENADQMGRLQTRLGNSLSGIQVGKNSYDNGVMSNYNGVMADVGNSQTSADREKVQKIAEILNARTMADNTFNTEVQNANDSIEAQKLQDLNTYNERLRQEQVAQAKAVQKATVKAQTPANQIKQDKLDIENEFYSMNNPTDREKWLNAYRQQIIDAAGGGNTGLDYFNSLMSNTGHNAVSYYSLPHYLNG